MSIGAGLPFQMESATGTVETTVNIPLTGVPPAWQRRDTARAKATATEGAE